MEDSRIFLFRYYVDGILHKAVIVAEWRTDAEKMLKERYQEFGIVIKIEEWECIEEDGIVLTWHEPIKD